MRTKYLLSSIAAIIFGSIFLMIGFFPGSLMIIYGVIIFLWSIFSQDVCINCNKFIPKGAKVCPSCGSKYDKKEHLKNLPGEIWIAALLSLGAIWVYLIATVEGDLFNFIFVLGGLSLFFVIMLAGGFSSANTGFAEPASGSYSAETERYKIKMIDNKPHLVKEAFPFDEDLGRLHKTFTDDLETRNAVMPNYKIGAKGIFDLDRAFYKKDKDEKGTLTDPNIFELVADDKYFTYKKDEHTNFNVFGRIFRKKTHNAPEAKSSSYASTGFSGHGNVNRVISENGFLKWSRMTLTVYRNKLLGLVLGAWIGLLLVVLICYLPFSVSTDVFAFINIVVLMILFLLSSFVFHGFVWTPKLSFKIVGMALNLLIGALFGYMIGYFVGTHVLWFVLGFVIVASIPIIGTIAIFFVSFWLGAAIWANYKGIVFPIVSGLATIYPVNTAIAWVGLPLFVIPLCAYLGFIMAPRAKKV